GLELRGTEVKALREGRVNLKESYARIDRNEVILHNCHINEYSHGNIMNHNPLRERKLLLHRKEIDRLRSSIQRDLTRARQASSKKSSSSTRKLQQENAMLKDKLKAMENVLKGMKSKLAAANKSAPKGLALFRTAAKPKTPKTQTVTIMRDHGATTLHDDHGSSDHGSGGSHAP
ncbi:MAG TPA: SsrA-binding protein, partial [Planctomycetes bacterium]|nr:SsrA-binding protein [Planctomycetota bacterium]